MGNFLRLIAGRPVSTAESSSVAIYDQSITVVASGATTNQINGPVTAGTVITLPASGSYTLNGGSVANINIYMLGQRLEQIFDWNTSGTSPYLAFSLTFDLAVGDRLDIRSERN